MLPPHDQWLKEFDCTFWGLDKLVEPALLQQNANVMERDMKETRDVLLQWAGPLQAIFTIYQLQVEITLPVSLTAAWLHGCQCLKVNPTAWKFQLMQHQPGRFRMPRSLLGNLPMFCKHVHTPSACAFAFLGVFLSGVQCRF